MMKGFYSKTMGVMDRIRQFLLNAFFLLFLIIFISVLFAARPEVPENAVLLLDFKGRFVEQIVRPNADSFPFSLPSPDQILLKDVVDVLRLAKNDPNIKMVKLELEGLQGAPLAKLQDVRRAIEDFKASGKPVVASGHAFTQAQYYLAATADRLFLHPMGAVELTGFALYRGYFKSMLDKLKVDVHLFRVGEFKSAMEPLVRDDMSEADRAANRVWLGTLWASFKDDIAAMRGIEPERIQELLDQPSRYLAAHGGSMARLLAAEKLVDELADKHEADAHIGRLLGGGASYKYPAIGYKQYLRIAGAVQTEPSSANMIGVVYASGTILNGEQPTGTVGGDTVAGLLRNIRMDGRYKAVVLRIDSPGGSALASEMIRKEVERIKEAGKPVIVSMGSMAASGGYWIAAPADEIWAQPTTITGSIGVFGAFASLHRSLAELGIHTDGLGTTAVAGGITPDRPLHPELAAAFQMGVEDVYRNFIQHVSEGRGMAPEAVDAIAQGRVWSGVDAKRIGLVDELGDLYAAIRAAAKRADIADDYVAMPVEPERKLADVLAEQLFGEVNVWMNGKLAGMVSALPGGDVWLKGATELAQFARLNDPNHIYAYSDLGD